MLVGHPGEPGAGALWHVVVDIKLVCGYVPILLRNGVAMIA